MWSLISIEALLISALVFGYYDIKNDNVLDYFLLMVKQKYQSVN